MHPMVVLQSDCHSVISIFIAIRSDPCSLRGAKIKRSITGELWFILVIEHNLLMLNHPTCCCHCSLGRYSPFTAAISIKDPFLCFCTLWISSCDVWLLWLNACCTDFSHVPLSSVNLVHFSRLVSFHGHPWGKPLDALDQQMRVAI